MRRRTMVRVILMILGALMLSACQEKETVSTDKVKVVEEPEKSDEKESEQNVQVEEDREVEDVQAESVLINIYFPNDEITDFSIETIAIDQLEAEKILEKLVEKGVLDSQVEIKSFNLNEEEKTIEIDFDRDFLDFISSMGSSGEYYIIGSISNTFLDAYKCDKVLFTVNGVSFSTGHAEYTEYMGKFS